MNPYEQAKVEPNFCLFCLLADRSAMCQQVLGETQALYRSESGKSCPTEILEKIATLNAGGRPVWKPMHMQPIYRSHGFVTRHGNGRGCTNAYIAGDRVDVGMDIYNRGLCLPSEIKMTPEKQDMIIAEDYSEIFAWNSYKR